jgi:uncharacterized protein
VSAQIIPVNRLSPEALRGAIEEFISREGTDYGEIEASPETSFRQVKYKLEKGLAALVYDDETQTANIFLKDNPILRRVQALADRSGVSF